MDNDYHWLRKASDVREPEAYLNQECKDERADWRCEPYPARGCRRGVGAPAHPRGCTEQARGECRHERNANAADQRLADHVDERLMSEYPA